MAQKVIGWKQIDAALGEIPRYKLTENILAKMPFNSPMFIKEKTKNFHTIMYFISLKDKTLNYCHVDLYQA